MSRYKSLTVLMLALFALVSFRLQAQGPVGAERLLNATKEPQNWMMYGADYFSQRYSGLTQMTPANVKSLNLAWAYQSPNSGSWQSTPLVVDGVMYFNSGSKLYAVNAATGQQENQQQSLQHERNWSQGARVSIFGDSGSTPSSVKAAFSRASRSPRL